MMLTRLTALIAIATATAPANAGCGTAFCSINTDWSTQGAWTERGARLDLRYEFIDQDQPRAGTSKIAVGAIPKHHDEVRTINRNLIGTYDYTFDANWGMSIVVPVVSRDHQHIHNHHGAALYEAWNFTRLGDVRFTGRYRFVPETPESSFGLQFGLKLPTGEFNVQNADGDIAERSLQPGTGTTDGIIGAFSHGRLGRTAAWFAELNLQAAFERREQYKPGETLGFDVGVRYPLGERVAALLQMNTLYKGKDSGRNAEPDDTGGKFMHLSPGLSVGLGDKTQLYGFVQLPLYQDVNGVQLTADWAAVAGISLRF
ncbi:MAG TPA: transporter [Burkholderiales bacterium]|nr:transporter [Burkholderiales bacterium]